MPRRLGSHGALLALGALVLVSTVARVVLSRGVDAPWIAPDEHLYGLVGRSLVNGDGFTIVGEPVPFYSFLYPLFVGLAQLGTSAATGLDGRAGRAGARHVRDRDPRVPLGPSTRRRSARALRSHVDRPHPRPRLQRAPDERGALLPGRGRRGLGARRLPPRPDAQPSAPLRRGARRRRRDPAPGSRLRRSPRRRTRDPRSRRALARPVPPCPGLPGRARSGRDRLARLEARVGR